MENNQQQQPELQPEASAPQEHPAPEKEYTEEQVKQVLESPSAARIIRDMVSSEALAAVRQQQAVKDEKKELSAWFAGQYGIPQEQLLSTVKEMCFPARKQNDGSYLQTASNAQLMAFLAVSKKYQLNPFIKEIYAFPTDNGGINPIVSVDGWNTLILRHKKYLRKTFTYSEEMVEPPINQHSKKPEHKPAHLWIECTIWIKGEDGQERSETYREYFDEVYREPFLGNAKGGGKYVKNGPWQTHTKRMHRHKALIQAARAALGFAGIYDEDEAHRIKEAEIEIPVDGEPNQHTQMWKDQPEDGEIIEGEVMQGDTDE